MTVLAPDHAPAAIPFADDLGRHGGQVALRSSDTTLTYAQLDRRVGDMAERLGPIPRLVLIEAANAVEALVAYLACLRGGHPVMLLPAGSREEGVLVATYEPDVVMAPASDWEPVERRSGSAHALHPDLALLLSTSGSTGSSKLVRLSRRNLASNARSIAQYLSITPEDRAVTTLPMQYCYGLSVINSHLASGAGLVLTQLSVVDRCFWEQFRATGATSFAGVPYTFGLLDRAGFDSMSLPTLRYVTQAGGRLQPDQVRRYAELGRRDGWELFVMYGQTEATARMAYLPPALAASHPQAIGVPIPGGSFTIEPLDGSGDRDEGGEGELVYHGPNVMLGYAEDRADLALGPTIDALHTGDLARRTPEGLYELVGRRSRFLKLYGLRVDLDHLERSIAATGTANLCTGDDEQLVVAVEDSRGEAVSTLVRENVGLPASSIRVVEVDALPRLPNGKPDYVGVRLTAASAATAADVAVPAAVATTSSDPDGDGIRSLFSEILGRDVGDDESFVTAGGDSLSYVETSIRLEEAIGPLPKDWHTTAVGDLAPVRRPRRIMRNLETSIVLRAVAIVLIVGTHTTLWHLPGGAHTLLGIAGYNFARFQLRARSMLPSIARLALPSMAWIGLAAAVTDTYAWPSALLLNGQLGGADSEWGYWYVEAVVQILVVLAVVFAVPGVRRLERRFPFALASAVLLAGLAVRFDVVDVASDAYRTSRTHEVLWVFALGWAAGTAVGLPRRAVVSALVLASVPGFFGAPHREAIVVVGLLLVLWVPTLPVPWPVSRMTGIVAASSLFIYLTHWQVLALVGEEAAPVATVAAVAAGVTAWWAGRAVTAAVGRAHVARVPTGLRGSSAGRRRVPPPASGCPRTDDEWSGRWCRAT